MKVHSINREALRLLTTALLLFLVCFVANAYDFRVDGIYYNVLDSMDLTCEVTGLSTSNSNYSAYQGSVDIPNTVEYENTTYTVTTISSYAFDGCTGLTSVTIGNSVTSIGNYAFYKCSGLTSVTIPNSVAEIGNYAFYSCTGLTEVTIPNSVETIGGSAFYGCTGLTSVNISNSVTRIEYMAFYGCSALTEVTIGNSVTTIDGYAFYGCKGLTEITIPNSVLAIRNLAFGSCSGLTSITSLNPEPPTCQGQVFPNSITNICILYVPDGSLEAYANADEWKNFYNIIEIEVDAIADITTNGNAEAVGYYTTDGKQVPTLQRGINVIRYSDGTTKKVLVK